MSSTKSRTTTTRKRTSSRTTPKKSTAKSSKAEPALGTAFDTQAMLHDFITTQKMVTGNYNYFAGECMHDELRSDVLNILQEEHAIQNDLFVEMNERGWYKVKEAPQSQIQNTKKKFS